MSRVYGKDCAYVIGPQGDVLGKLPLPANPPRRANHRKRSKLVRLLMARDGGACYYCGIYCGIEFSLDSPATVDHVIAKSKGGRLVPENTVLACGECNYSKGDMDAFTFIDKMKTASPQTIPQESER